ncbi:hypothetical protein MSKU15_1433 [Komagataeibacter diospyri]|uniref:DUF6232 family protein n=1 Tax=Komagataeibacter diospyri TaxID=1932662 RepID=UPI00113CF0C0|nr:DUF6232 family protein [Komagataeibacter diospyri]GCE89832.1 hypothetical protein MSKU15_1433 [Komagataeibacter diospyri]
MTDTVLYDDGKVSVSPRLVKIGAQSFATANISSVSITHTSRVWAAIIGCLFFLMGVGCFQTSDGHVVGEVIFFWGFAGLCAYGSLRPFYQLRIVPQPGRKPLLKTRNAARLRQIQTAIDRAISGPVSP